MKIISQLCPNLLRFTQRSFQVSRQTSRDQETIRAQLENRQRELETLTQQKDSIQSRLHQNQEDLVQYDDLKNRIQELGR